MMAKVQLSDRLPHFVWADFAVPYQGFGWGFRTGPGGVTSAALYL
jgi:hypothetical protein